MTAEAWRVAQIIVGRGGGQDSRGSGYLIAPGRVLTAAHVIAAASVLRVRLDVGQPSEIEVQAKEWRVDRGSDLAVISIPEAVTADREFEPTRFGRIGDGTAVLAVQAFGFPRFKLRSIVDPSAPGAPEGLARDLEHATGRAPIAANRRQGTLAVYLDDPPPAASNPWQGMSGAAVWVNDRIVAVVAEHHAAEGAGRLTARRIDAAALGLPDDMPDVIPPGPALAIKAAYLAQARDIAPDALVDRDTELAAWTEFCAGAEPYAWWQAGPWAGKTALASWFVTHPPAGVDIVSFFVTGRLSGQSDSGAFLDAMIEQLEALYPAVVASPATVGAKVGVWFSLLESAAAQSVERGRLLVIVLDGLDEDSVGAMPPRGKTSIASLLPSKPPLGVRFIITGRPDPGLPDDLPAGHPLRNCAAFTLPVSRVAKSAELQAKRELQYLLSGNQTAVDTVGYIAASGGGLTRSDLSHLTGAPPYELDDVLRGVFGHSFHARLSAGSRAQQASPETHVFLFAHETIRVIAEEKLGSNLIHYKQNVHEWIDSYARAGWPDNTPAYAIRGYLHMLAASEDVARLSRLARDRRRHEFLFRATGSDYSTLTEIRTAQEIAVCDESPDLHVLLELAAYRHVISIRNRFIPPELPAAWARLRHFDHAEALARAINSPAHQAKVFAHLAAATAQAGELKRAEALARAIADDIQRARALVDLVPVVAAAGDRDWAETLARGITSPAYRARALAGMAAVIARAGNLDHARQLATDAETAARTTSSYTMAQIFIDLAPAWVQAGDRHRAETLAKGIKIPEDQARSLTGIAAVVARTGDADHARKLAADAEATAGTIANLRMRADAFAELAAVLVQIGDRAHGRKLAAYSEITARAMTHHDDQDDAMPFAVYAFAQVGEFDRAETLARMIAKTFWRDRAFANLAAVVAQVGDHDRAASLARTIRGPYARAQALANLAAIIVETEDPARPRLLAAEAELIARTITSPYAEAFALADLTEAIAVAGDLDRAEAISRIITDGRCEAQATAGMAAAIAQAGDFDRAETLIRSIPHSDYIAEALAGLAAVIAGAGNPGRARRLAAEAESVARTISYPPSQAKTFATMIVAIAQVGDSNRARRLAAESESLGLAITGRPEDQARVLAGIAEALARAGEPDRAHRLAAKAEAVALTSPVARFYALSDVAAAIAQAGDLEHAEAIARTIADPGKRSDALAGLAGVIAQAGDPDRAETLARAASYPLAQARALADAAAAVMRTGDHSRACRLMARALIIETPAVWWIKTILRFAPSIIEGGSKILEDAYLEAAWESSETDSTATEVLLGI